MQIRGDPIAVIGDAGLHREFPGHSQIVLRGEGRRPADDPKARRPDAHVFTACVAVRLGIPMETEPGVTPPIGVAPGFFMPAGQQSTGEHHESRKTDHFVSATLQSDRPGNRPFPLYPAHPQR